MAIPTTRDQFSEYCLRTLGKPVIEINVDADQIDDRIDEALKMYWDYHFDGTEKIYYKHLITQTDINNKYITVPDSIIGAINIFDMNDPLGASGDMFSIRYQIALNDMYSFASFELTPYYLARQNLTLISEMLTGKKLFRYNRHMNRIYIDTDWTTIGAAWLVIEAYQIVDPIDYADVWKDQWLLRYATALIKRQWGSNLTKFIGMQLPGGVTFNGEKIYNDAIAEIQDLEEKIISSYSLPNLDMIG